MQGRCKTPWRHSGDSPKSLKSSETSPWRMVPASPVVNYSMKLKCRNMRQRHLCLSSRTPLTLQHLWCWSSNLLNLIPVYQLQRTHVNTHTSAAIRMVISSSRFPRTGEGEWRHMMTGQPPPQLLFWETHRDFEKEREHAMPRRSRSLQPHNRNNEPVWPAAPALFRLSSIQLNKSPRQLSKPSSDELRYCCPAEKMMSFVCTFGTLQAPVLWSLKICQTLFFTSSASWN